MVVEEPDYDATFTHDPIAERVYWSPEMCALFGLGPDDFGGTIDDFLRRVHPADRERISDGVEQRLRTPGFFCDELRIVRPDGVVRRLRIIGEALEGTDGETLLIAGAAEDISELDVSKPELAAELGLQ
jgi:PAS domain S-box-containing protein